MELSGALTTKKLAEKRPPSSRTNKVSLEGSNGIMAVSTRVVNMATSRVQKAWRSEVGLVSMVAQWL